MSTFAPWRKDRAGHYQGCNAAFARAAGVPRPDDIVGKNDYELAWEREQAVWLRHCDERVLATGEALLNIEEAERQADSRVAKSLTSKVPLRDTGGQVCGVLGIDTDISELKAAEAELRRARDELEDRVRERTADLATANEQLRREIAEREQAQTALRISQERYRQVAELTSDFAYAFRVESDGSFHVERVTDAFARITGHATAELDSVGAWERVVHPDDRPIMHRRATTLLAGQAITTEFRVVADDGCVRWLRDHARPMWDEREHRAMRILGAAQDITGRKEAEEEARQHEAALMHMARLSTMRELTATPSQPLSAELVTEEVIRERASPNTVGGAARRPVAARGDCARAIRELATPIREHRNPGLGDSWGGAQGHEAHLESEGGRWHHALRLSRSSRTEPAHPAAAAGRVVRAVHVECAVNMPHLVNMVAEPEIVDARAGLPQRLSVV